MSVKRTRPPAWVATKGPVEGVWNTLAVENGRTLCRIVDSIGDGVVHFGDGTKVNEADVTHTWVHWADVPEHMIDLDLAKVRY